MIVTLAVTLLLGLGTPASTDTVTFRSHAKRVSALLPELGEQLGIDLRTDKRAGDMVVFLSVDETRPDEILTKIAWATYSNWVDNDDGSKTLKYSDQLVQERTQELASSIRDKITVKADFAYSAQPDQFTAPDAKELALWIRGKFATQGYANNENAEGLAIMLPAHRLLKRAVALIDWQVVAVEGEATFSTFPDQWDHELPESASALLDQYKRELSLLRASLRPYGLTIRGVPTDLEESYDQVTFGPERFDIEVRAGRVTLHLRGPLGENWSDYAFLGIDESTAPGPKYTSTWAHLLPADFRIKLSQDTESILKLRRTLAFKQDPEVRALVLNPLERDPLSFFASDALSSIGQALDRNVVATLTDERRSLWIPWTTRDIRRLEWALADLQSLQDVLDEVWLSLRMPNPKGDRLRQVDRAVLSRDLRKTVADGRFLIADVLETWPRADDLGPRAAYYEGIGMLLPPTSVRINHNDVSLFGFLASLSPQEFDALSGRGLTVSQLSPTARAAVKGFHYSDNDLPNRDYMNLYYEGVPSDARLTLEFVRANPLAIMDALPEEPDGWYPNFFLAKTLTYDRGYLMNSESHFVLTIHTATGSASTEFGLKENEYGRNPTPYKELPPELQRILKEQCERMQKRRGGGVSARIQ